MKRREKRTCNRTIYTRTPLSSLAYTLVNFCRQSYTLSLVLFVWEKVCFRRSRKMKKWKNTNGIIPPNDSWSTHNSSPCSLTNLLMSHITPSGQLNNYKKTTIIIIIIIYRIVRVASSFIHLLPTKKILGESDPRIPQIKIGNWIDKIFFPLIYFIYHQVCWCDVHANLWYIR